MAQTSYVSPTFAAGNEAVKQVVYAKIQELSAHLAARTGGYTMDLVSIDYGITAANRVTVTVSDPLPQVARYNLTQVP